MAWPCRSPHLGGLPWDFTPPSEVKAAITGYGSADKRQVGTMVARVLRLDEVPRPADAADALALAICHAWRGGPRVNRVSERLTARSAGVAGCGAPDQKGRDMISSVRGTVLAAME